MLAAALPLYPSSRRDGLALADENVAGQWADGATIAGASPTARTDIALRSARYREIFRPS